MYITTSYGTLNFNKITKLKTNKLGEQYVSYRTDIHGQKNKEFYLKWMSENQKKKVLKYLKEKNEQI